MPKYIYDTTKWNSDEFHFHLDEYQVNSSKIKGWVINKSNLPCKLLFIDTSTNEQHAITCDHLRPNLPNLYPNVKNANNCGFEIPIDLDVEKPFKYKLCIELNNKLYPVAAIMSYSPLLFVHIAKTAGSTVNNFLTNAFGAESSLVHVESVADWGSKVEALDLNYISGHIPLTQFNKVNLLKHFEKAITFREPYSHVISHLAWVKALALPENRERFLNHPEYIQNLSLKLSHCDFSCANSLSKLINSFEGPEFLLFDNTQTRYIRKNIQKPTVDVEDIVDAIHNLKNFRFVGLDDDIDGFLNQLVDFYGFKVKSENSRDNVLNTKFGLDPSRDDIKKSLYPLIDKDLEIYQHLINRR